MERVLSQAGLEGFRNQSLRIFRGRNGHFHQAKCSDLERMATTEKEKAKLLIMPNGTSVPDPLTLKDGWVKESENMTSWPPIYLSDITLFLMREGC